MTQHDQIPIGELATQLAGDLPAVDRPAGDKLLRDDILPWELRNYPDHPQREKLASGVREDLAARLADAQPDQRLAVLAARALRDRVELTLGDAIDLALRRYAIDHPARAAAALEHVSSTVAALPRPEVEARAEALTAEIDQLEARCRTADTLEQHRLQLQHARMAAGAARTGSFVSAAGQLADELRRLGERPDELRVQ